MNLNAHGGDTGMMKKKTQGEKGFEKTPGVKRREGTKGKTLHL